MSYDTISRFVRNLHVLQESWKGLGVLTEFLMLDSDEMNMIKKINQELQEETWRKDGVLRELLTFYYDKTFTELSLHLRPSLNQWEPPSPP